MKKLIINILKYLFFLAFGVFLLWLSFRTLDLKEVWNDIVSADYFWILLALISAVIAHFFRALRWNVLINSMGYKTRISTTFYAVFIGYMANTAVPRMGEFMRCGVLSRKEKIPFNALFGSVISERIFDMLVLLLLLFSILFFQWSFLGDFVGRMMAPFFSVLASNSLVLITLAIIGVLILVSLIYLRYRYHHKIKELPGYHKIEKMFLEFYEGIIAIKRMKHKWRFIFYTVVIWVFYALMVYFPFFMLPETNDLSFMASITFLAIGSLGIVAPVPGGIGAYHFIGKAVLVELYSIDPSAAISFVTITHAGQTLLHIFVGGLMYFIMFFVDHKKPVNEKD